MRISLRKVSRNRIVNKHIFISDFFSPKWRSGLYFQAEYYEMNEKIEKMTKLAYLTLVKITFPGTLLPIVVASAFNYIYYGMGEDSFLLPFYVLYASRLVFGGVFMFKN